LIEILSYECICHDLEECGLELFVLRLNKIKKTWHVFGCLNWGHVTLRETVQKNEVGATEVVLPQVLNALLTRLHSVYNHVVKLWTGCRDSNIVLLVDGTKVSESTVEAINTS